MSPTVKHIYIIATFVMVTFMLWRFSEPKDDKAGEILLLHVKADSLITANKAKDQILVAYETKIDSFKITVAKKDKKISDLKQSKNEKVLHIDAVSSNELIGILSGIKP
jgi:hypothetical protein